MPRTSSHEPGSPSDSERRRDPADAPELTAVVAVGRLRDRAAGCLASLLACRDEVRLEILLLDRNPERGPVAGADHPCVRVVPQPPDALFATMRTAAVFTARAPVVAFLEEHVRVRPGWAAALVAAHREPWTGVGAVVEPANPERGKSRLIGAMSYGGFSPPVSRGEVEMLPGHNASFKTAALRSLGPEELERLLHADLVLHARLRARGDRFLMEPAARIGHLNETRGRTIARGLFLFYRIYGPMRAAEGRWSFLRRLAYVVGAPLVPPYFLLLASVRWRTRPGLRRHLWRHLPTVLFVQLAAGLGQAVGLLLGPGDAPARFTRYELEEPRPE